MSACSKGLRSLPYPIFSSLISKFNPNVSYARYASHLGSSSYTPSTPILEDPHSLHQPVPSSFTSSESPSPLACLASQRSLCGSGDLDPLVPPSRFDWRLRATSRPRPSHKQGAFKVQSHGRRRGPKRVAPLEEDAQKGDPLYAAIQAYKDHFLPLLAAEQGEDEAVLRERLSSWSVERLKSEGYCLTDLGAYWLEKNMYGRPVASFSLGPGIKLPEHKFEKGMQILLTRLDPLKELPHRGSVLSTTETQLRIAFQDVDKRELEIDSGLWRLDIGNSNIVYSRMRDAIRHLNHDPAKQEQQSGWESADRQTILQGTGLRDIILRGFIPPPSAPNPVPAEAEGDESRLAESEDKIEESEPVKPIDNRGVFKDDMRIQSWATRYSSPDPVVVEGDPVIAGLNSTQIRAVAMMLGQRFTLVQGPPGTGKTKTIIEACKLLKAHFEVPHPVLLCTYTNVAVDNLVEGLLSAGLKPLRVGFGGRVEEALRQTTLDHKLSMHPLKGRYDTTLKQIEALDKRKDNLTKALVELGLKDVKGTMVGRIRNMELDLAWMEKQSSSLGAKAYAIHCEMLKDIVDAADVVCTTCITSATRQLQVVDFPVVFIDEATMSTEPASLIPLMKGSQHVALIGDHKQLPPVITSPEAQAKGLGISMFERLAEEGAVPSIMLDIQYRMHPMISQFPSNEFYKSGLRDGTVDASGAVTSRLLPPEFSLPLAPHDRNEGPSRPSVIFLDHQGVESIKDRSRVNINEAHLVCSIIEDLLLQNETLRGHDIGIIAPYVAQIALLNRFLNTDVKYKNRFEAVLGSHRAMQIPHIEVKTVDGFEGREKDVIIFSTVRNNATGHIGFLADRRRLNVGLTRAKRGLFVLGNIETLKAGRTGRGGALDIVNEVRKVGKGAEAWRRYAQFLDEEKLIAKLDGDRLRKVLYGNIGTVE
ncbi:P-loop containing nucleoside triphosphate hydrolase protein [Panus rudis PR-1116 ss-1]|nr:P-loop containing nucleoside triphosphate hydrolase protein [Panus rudis PR-1116 ss-1]